MKRKKFLFISAIATAAIALPIVKYGCQTDKKSNSLDYPATLDQFCDEQEVIAIGNFYRKLKPDENSRERLEELLLTDNAGKQIDSNYPSISKYLDQKISWDFLEKKTVIANGWVISVTEARQCALFSMT